MSCSPTCDPGACARRSRRAPRPSVRRSGPPRARGGARRSPRLPAAVHDQQVGARGQRRPAPACRARREPTAVTCAPSFSHSPRTSGRRLPVHVMTTSASCSAASTEPRHLVRASLGQARPVRQLLHEHGRAIGVTPPHAHVREPRPDDRERVQLVAGLIARPDHGDVPDLLGRQVLRGHTRRRRRCARSVRYPPSSRNAAGSPVSLSKTITMPSLAGSPSSTLRGKPRRHLDRVVRRPVEMPGLHVDLALPLRHVRGGSRPGATRRRASTQRTPSRTPRCTTPCPATRARRPRGGSGRCAGTAWRRAYLRPGEAAAAAC